MVASRLTAVELGCKLRVPVRGELAGSRGVWCIGGQLQVSGSPCLELAVTQPIERDPIDRRRRFPREAIEGIAEVYGCADVGGKFMRDFVNAWVKVMNADRFDLVRSAGVNS